MLSAESSLISTKCPVWIISTRFLEVGVAASDKTERD
jgi:hypothetical protein